jgi:hypothetical protein
MVRLFLVGLLGWRRALPRSRLGAVDCLTGDSWERRPGGPERW